MGGDKRSGAMEGRGVLDWWAEANQETNLKGLITERQGPLKGRRRTTIRALKSLRREIRKESNLSVPNNLFCN